MNRVSLTVLESYKATFEFLLQIYDRTKSAEIGSVLGDLSLLEDGTPADSAAWSDWLKCVEKACNGDVDAKLKLAP